MFSRALPAAVLAIACSFPAGAQRPASVHRLQWLRSGGHMDSLTRVIVTVLGLALAGVTNAGAQPLEASLRGRVVLTDTVTPAARAVIEAVLVSDPTYRSRTLAGSNGEF